MFQNIINVGHLSNKCGGQCDTVNFDVFQIRILITGTWEVETFPLQFNYALNTSALFNLLSIAFKTQIVTNKCHNIIQGGQKSAKECQVLIEWA